MLMRLVDWEKEIRDGKQEGQGQEGQRHSESGRAQLNVQTLLLAASTLEKLQYTCENVELINFTADESTYSNEVRV